MSKKRGSLASWLTPQSKLSRTETRNAPATSRNLNLSDTPSPSPPSPSRGSPPQPSRTFEDEDATWPQVYNLEQWQEKRKEYPWLASKDFRMGCNVCCRVTRLNLMTETQKRGLHLAKEWVHFEVEASHSDKRETQLASIRNKIRRHENSVAHKKCLEIVDNRRRKEMTNAMEEISVQVDETTKRVFRTAYYIAKNNRPYTDHETLVELQKLNDVKLGHMLHGRNTAAAIIDKIAIEMRRRVVEHIKDKGSKLSVLVDESTTEGKKAVLIVYIRACILSDNPEYIMLDVVELESRKAEDVTSAIRNCLYSAGFSEEYLQDHWVSFVSDGASVMLGKLSGVGVRLKEKYSKLLLWHCLNHRLELAVSDAIDKIAGVNHFKFLMDKLYSHFSQSTKNRQELNDVAVELGLVLQVIGRVLSVRWSASSLRAVKAVWNAIPALHQYFMDGSRDKERDGTTQATMLGIAKRLESKECLCDLALMYDLLEELSILSKSLQDRDMTLARADQLCFRTTRVVQSFSTDPGTHYKAALQAVETGEFRGVTLTDNPRQRRIDKDVLINNLVQSLTLRLHGTGLPSQEGGSSECCLDEEVIDDLEVLYPSHWPEELPSRFGEDAVRRLCERFNLHAHEAVNGFRDFIEDCTCVPESLRPLKRLADTFPVSSAECERGFSVMNLICTDLRTRLTIPHLSSLMFVNINGPPVSQFRPDPYVRQWLIKHKGATQNPPRKASASLTLKPFWKLL